MRYCDDVDMLAVVIKREDMALLMGLHGPLAVPRPRSLKLCLLQRRQLRMIGQEGARPTSENQCRYNIVFIL